MLRYTWTILLSQLLCIFNLQAQEEIARVNGGTIKVAKKEQYLIPTIVGKTEGNVDITVLLSDTIGIVVDDEEITITNFEMILQEKGNYLAKNNAVDRGFRIRGNQLTRPPKEWLVKYARPGHEIIFDKITAQKNGETIKLKPIKLDVKAPLKATVGNKTGGRILSGIELCAESQLLTNDPEVKITSFTMSTVTQGKWTKNSSGRNLLTDGMCEVLHQNVTFGSRIIFENIKARNADNEIIDLPSITFEIY